MLIRLIKEGIYFFKEGGLEMALDLEGYIKQSYERPNKAILEGLGANEQLIEYLMETPGNMNWQVVESIEGSGGGDDDWTVIRLSAVEDQEQPGTYLLVTDNLDDVNNFKTLLTLEHPIIQTKYLIHSYEEDKVCNSELGIGVVISLSPASTILAADLFLQTYISETFKEGAETVLLRNLDSTNANDYLEIKYKTANTYYTINVADYYSIYMVPGGQWQIPTGLEASFTDGTHTYAPGDIITVNSDIRLDIAQEG